MEHQAELSPRLRAQLFSMDMTHPCFSVNGTSLLMPQEEATSTLTWFWFKTPEKGCWFSQTLLFSKPSPGFLPHSAWQLPRPGLLLPLRLFSPPHLAPIAYPAAAPLVTFTFSRSYTSRSLYKHSLAFVLSSAWSTFVLNIFLACFLFSFRPWFKCHFLQEVYPETLGNPGSLVFPYSPFPFSI